MPSPIEHCRTGEAKRDAAETRPGTLKRISLEIQRAGFLQQAMSTANYLKCC
ncbi:hypothetical protein [Roseibium sp. MMSF_3412]|uniref:hypothetical protein n=1 Tax=Roseibium sp. MMSF_3412 TaxID=3046712 RepID=UPI00273DCEFE|nr:hypothetical protein [Roseibium sp. MMSF_3412]